jgi:phosphohistidine swiveling domain-containing protein
MVDINKPWVVDSRLSERFTVYTRGNAGEVAGMVASPLQQTVISGWRSETAWRQALIDFGAFDECEFSPDSLDIIGVAHGYIYINLSIQRVFGVRMPGASAELMDRTYLGSSSGAPEYVEQPGDSAPQYAERIGASIGRVMSTTSRPDLEEDAQRALELRRARPDYSAMSDHELVAYSNRVNDEYTADFLRKHMLMMYESSIVTGFLDETLGRFDDSTLGVRLMGGWGGVASAAPAIELWRIGRLAAVSELVTKEFEVGVDGVLDRLRSRGEVEARSFVEQFEGFIFEYGSRSSQEWDIFPPDWESHPEMVATLVNQFRKLPEDSSPEATGKKVSQGREALLEELRVRLADDAEGWGQLQAAVAALSVWMPARELSKTNFIKALHETRLPLRELGKRFADRGVLESFDDLALLRLDEVSALIDDPSVVSVIAERKEWIAELERREPPFVVVAGDVPSPTTWEQRTGPSALPVAGPGETLSGLGACPGSATGVARVIMDPSEAEELEPGEILVAPETDPGWTPLFTTCAGVVVNVGSPLSHAAIVSRELGIPAVLAVEQATKRIKSGTLLTVDGTTGTVTVH